MLEQQQQHARSRHGTQQAQKKKSSLQLDKVRKALQRGKLSAAWPCLEFATGIRTQLPNWVFSHSAASHLHRLARSCRVPCVSAQVVRLRIFNGRSLPLEISQYVIAVKRKAGDRKQSAHIRLEEERTVLLRASMDDDMRVLLGISEADLEENEPEMTRSEVTHKSSSLCLTGSLAVEVDQELMAPPSLSRFDSNFSSTPLPDTEQVLRNAVAIQLDKEQKQQQLQLLQLQQQQRSGRLLSKSASNSLGHVLSLSAPVDSGFDYASNTTARELDVPLGQLQSAAVSFSAASAASSPTNSVAAVEKTIMGTVNPTINNAAGAAAFLAAGSDKDTASTSSGESERKRNVLYDGRRRLVSSQSEAYLTRRNSRGIGRTLRAGFFKAEDIDGFTKWAPKQGADNDPVLREFAQVREAVAKSPRVVSNAATDQQNFFKNRYNDVLPYESTRVVLNPRESLVLLPNHSGGDDSSGAVTRRMNMIASGGSLSQSCGAVLLDSLSSDPDSCDSCDSGTDDESDMPDSGTYINASYVRDRRRPEGRTQVYVCAQAPLPSTVEDFWRMIFQTRSPVVVMLTRLVENNRVKAHQYWPDRVGASHRYIEMTVKFLSEEQRGPICVRKFLITARSGTAPLRAVPSSDDVAGKSVGGGSNSYFSPPADLEDNLPPRAPAPNSEPLIVHQLQYLEWPDMGVPSDADGLERLIREVDIRKGSLLDPITVHCSAGIGRTGTFVAVHMNRQLALQDLVGRHTIDVRETVVELRKQRRGMVQTAEQYKFAHVTLRQVLQAHQLPSRSLHLKKHRRRSREVAREGSLATLAQIERTRQRSHSQDEIEIPEAEQMQFKNMQRKLRLSDVFS